MLGRDTPSHVTARYRIIDARLTNDQPGRDARVQDVRIVRVWPCGCARVGDSIRPERPGARASRRHLRARLVFGFVGFFFGLPVIARTIVRYPP